MNNLVQQKIKGSKFIEQVDNVYKYSVYINGKTKYFGVFVNDGIDKHKLVDEVIELLGLVK